ncbi:MAG TPA: redoxin domain-containing protein [Acidimicrobiales bacterium]|jgi:peroxiredoxin|nr:redoxin domain-containing protein [Acidimicrobiales bacterium]
MALAPGDTAPDFTLLTTPDQKISLSEFDVPVVLIFYPADWSPVCGDELTMFEAASRLFHERGAQLLGISVDGVWSHQAFRADHKIEFPLLSDFEPKGEVARLYGVYREGEGVCDRALFVIDRDRKVAWSYVSPIGVNPGADGALKAVEELS